MTTNMQMYKHAYMHTDVCVDILTYRDAYPMSQLFIIAQLPHPLYWIGILSFAFVKYLIFVLPNRKINKSKMSEIAYSTIF